MKNYIKKIGIMCLVVFSIMACETKETMVYEGKDVIYFSQALERRLDSIPISFAFDLEEVTDKIVDVKVRVQGYTTSYDRIAKIEVLDDQTTATEGVHFNLPREITVLKDSVYADIPVEFIRTDDMETEIFNLKFKLVPNDHFEVKVTGDQTSSNSKTSRPVVYDEFEISVSDQLVEPSIWNRFMVYLLGDFSRKKVYLFAEVNEIAVPDFSRFPNLSTIFNQTAKFKSYLNAQKAAGTPVLEDDGTEMIVP
ncbi:DUF4843 domain-containing protein [Flavivirga spongiicola]|uniref:DUF4843 domain-containing protein n=1 Tax=Flavivirga spongiicola TaxID=421621 RepID=A0ABU7XVR7_9FLAO|nr:DUF4843 domain-containing protein [Flavivirga sp. MEBiC05379]MDO5979505.1 DUF4843 domain-containing protein [Flavivirga sp. MEBiC05379]